MVTRAMQKAFDLAKDRGWDKTYWAFDIDDTMIVPNYEFGNIPSEFIEFS